MLIVSVTILIIVIKVSAIIFVAVYVVFALRSLVERNHVIVVDCTIVVSENYAIANSD